jgi:NADPH:quinone reductase-like Zn-dependent oxidoreductase
MRAYAIDHFGEAGSVRDLPSPDPAPSEVLVRVHAAGVNPFDAAVAGGYLKDMMEHRFPLIPGMDASGVIEAIGAEVEGWSEGNEVFGSVGKRHLGEGTFAEQVMMSPGTITRKPSSVSHKVAAATPVPGATAAALVDALALRQGETVVAVGASGGVGSFFVQLAAARGAHVIAVCSGSNADYVRSLGASDVIDYTSGDVAQALRARHPDEIDAIADMVGNRDELAPLVDLLFDGGRLASIVGAADLGEQSPRGIRATNVSGRVTTDALEPLAAGLANGSLKLPAIEVLPLNRADEALDRVAAHHVRGKLVLTID